MLLSGEDQSLLVQEELIVLVPDLGLDIVNGVRRLGVQGDAFGRRRSVAVVPEEFLVLVLDLGLDNVNGVRCLGVQGGGLACERFDEDLHASAEAQHNVECGLRLEQKWRQTCNGCI